VSKKQAREIAERKRKNRNLMFTVALALGTLVVVLIIAYLVFFHGNGGTGKIWHLDGAGLLAFDARPQVKATSVPVETTAKWSLENVSYRSFDADVHALLRIPTNVSHPPVVIVLPAASINKEADHAMAEALSSWGYATLTLDERGNNGETPGPSAMDTPGGYQAFASGGDPVQYEQVYDVLLGYDYIKSRPDLDGSNVVVLGESMGTRIAIISAALEPGLKGVVEISAGPYGPPYYPALSEQFIKSIEPANYLSKLPPRNIAFFHFTNDPVIGVALGRQLYDAASEPKAWHQYNGSIHGLYSDVFASDLHYELRSVFGR
jgi:dienelactone hydrolase